MDRLAEEVKVHWFECVVGGVQSLFCLRTALHVSGIIMTHLQEHKTTVTTASGNRYTVLLSAAIVEELEVV